MSVTFGSVKNTSFSLILDGIALMATLAWSDVVTSAIDRVYPERETLVGKTIYAIFVTIAGITILLYFDNKNNKNNKNNNEKI